MKKALLFLGVIATSALVGGVAAYTLSSQEQRVEYVTREVERSPSAGSHFTSYNESSYPDLTYAAENAVFGVVNIEAIKEVQLSQKSYDPLYDFFGIPQQRGQNGGNSTREQRSGGSGVIISEDGYIVTNNHVIDGATKLKVNLYDGRSFDGKIIGTDPTTDIALIKIDGEELPTIPFGSSDALRLGEWVLAIGSPFDLRSTITAGIVSAKARQLDVIPDQFRIESFIQTDAAVNPGNSGGALINTRGELVGINTLIKSQTGSYVGYSFAVPETIVRKVVTDLKEFGVVQRAMLGISFRPIDQNFIDEMGEEVGVKKIGGVYVAAVTPDGAASQAGVRKGDIILEFNGVELNDKVNLQEQIGKLRPNDKAQLKIKRGNSVKQIEVTLRNRANKAELLTSESIDVAKALGGTLKSASQRLIKELDIEGGVQVVTVKSGGLLARARVKEGFVITHINNKRILTMSDVESLTQKVESIDGVYPSGRGASYMFVE
ncbi:MAG: trypsin-like peptidase domain-containing protein [Rikenellaceae bacterium]